MNYFKFTLLIFIIALVSISCKKELRPYKIEKNSAASGLKYAKGFEIQHFKDYKKVIIKAPYKGAKETFEFILRTSKTTVKNEINIPINSIVVTSTTHIPFIELLNEQEKIVGFPNTNFISSPKTRKLIDDNKLKELGHPENINTETLVALNPDVVIGFSLTSNNKMFNIIEQIGIPVILNGDWLEETPLGRAEWIKFYGVLFNKEKEADSIFNSIEKNYLEAVKIAKKSKEKPTLLAGGLFKDVWYLPAGDSFEATFLRDANVNYLWNEFKGKGSLALNIESVFEKGKNASIWISPSFHESLKELEETNAIYSQFKAFQTQNIYSYMKTKGATGGIIYFELSPTRPDFVLKDLIKIAHPELLKDYEFTFYKKLN
ncbi:ABC transporter substrate-binding protein [Lutibacter sp.]|uniref:ABC transporter substrate-binding protein n=1 Tax=Lutibacter sp. TaxID=1925666 RepID=UPI001A2832E5|nr:ABC transporter substrate-binding protein [Lutibacter sp.]MBI9042581.1 ABC transporter substrate-binding protein [Lutibacter sp.]